MARIERALLSVTDKSGIVAFAQALSSLAQRWEAVICADTAHVHIDEGGAPEQMAGLKLWPVPTPDGKLTPALVDTMAIDFGFVHRAQPAVVTIAQSTELGTVYSPEEIAALADHVHGLGMRLHMDGARLANAAAGLGVPLRAITTDAGVDAVKVGIGAGSICTTRVVAGIGLVTPLGNNRQLNLEALRSGRSGVGTISRFDPSEFPSQMAGEVKGFDPSSWVDETL